MARGLGMTALRAALGGAAGGLRGYRETQEDRAKEAERKRIVDAAIRAEQRQAIGMGMTPSSRFNARGVAGGMDMPGATPRQPAFRQQIGDEEYVLGEMPEVAQHRAGLFKRREDLATQEALGDIYETTGLTPKGQGRMVARMPTSSQQIALNAVQAAERAKREAGEFDRREAVRARRARAEGGTQAGGKASAPKGPEFENTKYTALERALSRAEDALDKLDPSTPEYAAAQQRANLLRDNLERIQDEQGIVRRPPPAGIPAGAVGGSYIRQNPTAQPGQFTFPKGNEPQTDQQQMQEAIRAVQDDPDLTFEEKLEATREIQAAAAARRRAPRTP